MKLHHMLIVLKINQQNAYYQKKNIKRNKIKFESKNSFRFKKKKKKKKKKLFQKLLQIKKIYSKKKLQIRMRYRMQILQIPKK